jgi:hypothetical protein
MSGKDVWNPGPKGFKGGKLGWVEMKVREEMLKKIQTSQIDLSKEIKNEDYKSTVNNFSFKRLL